MGNLLIGLEDTVFFSFRSIIKGVQHCSCPLLVFRLLNILLNKKHEFVVFECYRMKRIQEHGLQGRENRLLYEKRPKCSGRESNFVSVSMVDCYPAFLVLSYGALIALCITILENLSFRRHELKQKMSCMEKSYISERETEHSD